MHLGPEDVAVVFGITWPQDSCIDGLLQGLLQHQKGGEARLIRTLRLMCQEISTLHKHELIVLGVLQTKGNIGPTECDDPLPGVPGTGCRCCKLLAESFKPFIHHGKEQVVLITEVQINRRRRVANALSHLAQREMIISLLKEQLCRRRQYGLTELLLLLVLPVADRLAQTFGLGDGCSFLRNSAPLVNAVILTGKRVFVNGVSSGDSPEVRTRSFAALRMTCRTPLRMTARTPLTR